MTDYNLSQFYRNLTDQSAVLLTYQFVAQFTGLAAIFGTAESVKLDELSYYVQAADIPGVTLTKSDIPFYGTQFHMPGVRQFKHSWSCKMLMTEDIYIYQMFRAWQLAISDLKNNGGGMKQIPNTAVRLQLLNSNNSPATEDKSITLVGLWVKTVGEISLEYTNGGSSPLNSFPIEFRYQYSYLGEKDPLEQRNNY